MQSSTKCVLLRTIDGWRPAAPLEMCKWKSVLLPVIFFEHLWVTTECEHWVGFKLF